MTALTPTQLAALAEGALLLAKSSLEQGCKITTPICGNGPSIGTVIERALSALPSAPADEQEGKPMSVVDPDFKALAKPYMENGTAPVPLETMFETVFHLGEAKASEAIQPTPQDDKAPDFKMLALQQCNEHLSQPRLGPSSFQERFEQFGERMYRLGQSALKPPPPSKG